jgi:uncharacterized cupredoxin-like copper-binding protein
MNKIWHLVGILALCACVNGAPSAFAAGPHVVKVVAKEYGYEMPKSIPAGPTLFHLTDDGNLLHQMTLIKLGQGKTLADLTKLPPGPFPAWAKFMGGPNTPLPKGGQSEVAVNLPAGHYAVVCLIPGADGVPHMMIGMERALTVKSAKQARRMPAADMTLKLVEYAFKFSKAPTAGHHVIRVMNRGTQPHEAEFFRLQHGKTGEDVLKWVITGMQGPPPGAPVSGVTAMAPGRQNTLMVDFSRGDYTVICFMPDTKDGKPHAAHGMIHNFKVM